MATGAWLARTFDAFCYWPGRTGWGRKCNSWLNGYGWRD